MTVYLCHRSPTMLCSRVMLCEGRLTPTPSPTGRGGTGRHERERWRTMRILISGGGTGGHIYPALAVASELRERYGAELLFIGDENGLETDIVPAAGVPFAGISAGKLRRYLSTRTFSDLARIPVGMKQAYDHVRQFRPHAAFTSGGYVSVPAGVAARLNGAPLVM